MGAIISTDEINKIFIIFSKRRKIYIIYSIKIVLYSGILLNYFKIKSHKYWIPYLVK